MLNRRGQLAGGRRAAPRARSAADEFVWRKGCLPLVQCYAVAGEELGALERLGG